jgi:sugar O-acyltransferase (sialic acid O-acetyltransferase NeuD family)
VTIRVAIFGAGSLARLAAVYLAERSDVEFAGFVVDEAFNSASDGLVHSWPSFVAENPPETTQIFVAVGYRDFRGRSKVFERIESAGYGSPNILCSGSYVSPHASMGSNNFVMPGVVVEPWVSLGDNNVIWSNATICHDARIASNSFIAANVTLGGHVSVGSRSFLGFSSVVRERVIIGDDVLLGMNSALLTNAHSCSVYLGSPAQRIRGVNPSVGIRIQDRE